MWINNFNRCTTDGNGSVIFSGRSKVDNHFFCPTDNYREVDFMAPQGQIFHFPSVGPLIFVTNKSDHSGIICRFYDVVVISGNTVVCKQAVEQRTEKAALWHNSPKQSLTSVCFTYSHSLGPGCQKIK